MDADHHVSLFFLGRVAVAGEFQLFQNHPIWMFSFVGTYNRVSDKGDKRLARRYESEFKIVSI